MFNSPHVNVPILGLVENMAYFTPAEHPDEKYYIFGNGGCKRLAEEMNVELLGEIPLVASICEGGDTGVPVSLQNTISGEAFRTLARKTIAAIDKRNSELPPTLKVEMNQ